MRPLRMLWHLLDARQRRRLVVLQFVAAFMALSTLIGVASLMPFLAVVADPAQIAHYPPLAWLQRSSGFDERGMGLALGTGFVLAVLLSNAVNMLGTLAITRFALQIGDGFHAALLAEYLRRDHAFHLQAGNARLFNRVIFMTNRIAQGILESGLLLVASAAVAVLIMVSIVWVNPWVALIAVLWLGGGYVALYGASRRRLLHLGVEESALIDARTQIAGDALGAVRDIKLYGLESDFASRLERACRAISRIAVVSQSVSHTPRYAMECLTVAGLVGAALFLSHGDGTLAWVAPLSFLGFAAYRLLPAVQQVFVSLVRIRANSALFSEVVDDLASAVARPREIGAAAMTPLVPRRQIALDRISFRFDAHGHQPLREVSAVIPAGSMVGITGANGSGKSTLLDVLMALHRPVEGRLLVDDVEIGAHNRAAWQRSVSVVPQAIYLLNATLAENIAFGSLREEIDAGRLDEAARRARLTSLLETLPRGFDEIIGNGGRELSGGERQRVAIARALYRDCAVLLLDEATSSLDALTEHEILELLRGLRASRTIIFVAHRMNTLRECDLILELDAGTITHAGSFDELVGRSSNFRRMAAGSGAAKH
jgi:ABC-type multidrug transport system fused ATPase/permease subunit